MITEKIITLDLAARGAAIQIGEAAVAGDHDTRTLVFSLTENGQPWIVPEGTRAALAFLTEGGFSGEYDTMPDGSDAFSFQENRVKVRLIDQILKNPGWVRLMLVLRRDLMEQLSSFPILMTVTEGLQGGDALPTEYYRVRDLADVNAELTLFANQLKQAEAQTAQAIAQHDASAYAHGDIRLRIEKLTNDKLDADRLPQALESALTEAKESGEFDGEDGYTPVRGVDYDTPEDRQALKSYITDELAKRGQLQPLFVESAEWLEANGDKSMLYVLPDGMIYAWMPTTQIGGPGYTNLLPDAVDTDGVTIYGGDYDGDGKPDGFLNDTRLSGSSGSTGVASGGMCASGFIPASDGAVVRIKGTAPVTGVQSYLITYDSAMARLGNVGFGQDVGVWAPSAYQSDQVTYEDGILTVTLDSSVFGTGIAFVRVSGHMDENTIITVNQEISENGGTVLIEKWASTGHAFVPADYDTEIADLWAITTAHTAQLQALEQGATKKDPLTLIRNWDAPIYDANIPLFRLSAEKPSMAQADMTPTGIYAMYDALMERHPQYITKTDLGLCSDGIHPVYRYDFRLPEARHNSGYQWSETKPKAILLSGIHYEWAGIFGLYYALEEIAENPELWELKRNTHLIVIPCANPFATLADQYSSHGGVRNANGVEIHRNFDTDFLYPEDPGFVPYGELHHGGTEPLSEPETRYIDKVLKENADAAFFMTCHNFDQDVTYGVGFLWASTATAYMCNMGYRLIDRMSHAWMEQYGGELAPGLASYRTEAVAEWDTRLGHAALSNSPGTETKQATKYGIQGTNLEICCRFYVHGTQEEPEPMMSAFTMSRGAEALVNFMLMAFGLYRDGDKERYYLN